MTELEICETIISMSNQSAQRTTKYLEVQGPKEAAANYLADRGYRIIRVDGTNGHDSKNETAEEYIVLVEKVNHGPRRGPNLELLTAYHAGDRALYLEDLRNDVKLALRHYASEVSGRPTFVLGAQLNAAIDQALAEVDRGVKRVRG